MIFSPDASWFFEIPHEYLNRLWPYPQIPVENWHEVIANPTLADAIMDRLIHSAYKINLKGESMRKKKSKLT